MREELVQFRDAEQEEDGGDESKHANGDRARDDQWWFLDRQRHCSCQLKFKKKEAQGVNGKLTGHFLSLRRRGPRRQIALKPVIVPAVKTLGIPSYQASLVDSRAPTTKAANSGSIRQGAGFSCLSFASSGQQKPARALFYIHVEVKANFAERNPYVVDGNRKPDEGLRQRKSRA